MAGIQVEKVRKVFGKYEGLKTVSLDVRDQEFTVLLGLGLRQDHASAHHRRARDRDLGRGQDRRPPGQRPAAAARQLAMVFQNYAVFPHMTVFENIAFGLRMQKKADEAVVKRKVEWAAELMHIESQLPKYTGQLSGGSGSGGRGTSTCGRAAGALDG